MKTFAIHVKSPSRQERIDEVLTFVGADASGSFGIQANHERMITILNSGIASLRLLDGHCEYLGLANAVLYFVENELHISTAKYLRECDYNLLFVDLMKQIKVDETEALLRKQTIRQMEEALIKQLIRPLKGGWQ